MHGQCSAAEEELVQQVDSGVGLVGLLAGPHQLLHHRAQGKDAVIGVHLVLLELLHVTLDRLDVPTHLHAPSWSDKGMSMGTSTAMGERW